MWSVVWLLLGFAVCGALYWFAFRIEPHWVSKDGQRVLCNAQFIDQQGAPIGRAKETRVVILGNGLLQVDQKKMLRRRTEFARIVGKDLDAKGKHAIYVLRGGRVEDGSNEMIIRLPVKSRAIPELDALMERTKSKRST